jgi:hypothetical protein
MADGHVSPLIAVWVARCPYQKKAAPEINPRAASLLTLNIEPAICYLVAAQFLPAPP